MNMKRYIGYMMMAAGALAVASCTDFSDYNDMSSGDQQGGDMTLWQNISSRSDLSDFAALVKRVGFDTELGNSRTYTVWAPVNGSFDKSVYDNMSDSLVLAQFVYNHVAQYSHGAIGVMPESSRIYTLNLKSYPFVGSPGAYAYGGVAVRTPNVGCMNGVLHLLEGKAEYKDNLYQYLDAVTGCDSIKSFFKRYDMTYLDQINSVEGPVIEGKPTWVDSVMITENALAERLNVEMDNEDSTYVMLMPNDKAFLSMYNTISSYYNYRSQVTVLDPSALTSASGTNTKTSTKIDNAYLRDSLTRRFIVRDLFYSRNDSYNKWAEDMTPSALTLDTLRSTTREKLSNGLQLLAPSHRVEEVQLSNGTVYVVDTLPLKPDETYLPIIFNNASRNLAKWFATGTSTAAPKTVRVNDIRSDLVADPRIQLTSGQLSYVELVPSGTGSKTTTFYTLNGVRSTTYNFYLLMAPANVSQTDSTMNVDELLPNLVNATLYYTNANGASAVWNFDSTKPTTSARSHSDATAFTIPKDSISYTYLGQVNIPVCYAGLPTGETPVLKLESRITPRQSARLGYDATMRVMGIVMVPALWGDNHFIKL